MPLPAWEPIQVSLCDASLCRGDVSEISLGGKICESCCLPQISVPHVPVLCSCVAWVVLELCTVSSRFSFLTPLWEGLC